LPAVQSLPKSFKRFLAALFVFGSGDFAKNLLVLWAIGTTVSIATRGSVTLAILLYAGFNLVTVVAALVGGRLSDHFGRKRVLLFGYACGVIGGACPVVFAPSALTGAIALGLSGVLVGIEEAVERAWAADLAPEGKRGRAFGYVHTLNGVGDFVASALIGGLWAAFGARIAFGVAAVLMAVGALLLARLPEGAAPRGSAASGTALAV
jgi:MFS family permease